MRTWLLRLAIVSAVYFAVQGGEYSTYDLFRQKNRERTLSHAVDSLERDIDSLRRLRRLLESDPATQERVAREDFGMIRDKELLFRFIDPDSVKSRRP
ncbi:MAG TPA: septum formation initiator family protein [Gemmatimonadaceae bacterium]